MLEPLAFPLTKAQAQELLMPSICKPTELSKTHRCWQVNKSFLKFSNPTWQNSISSVLKDVCSILGIPSEHVSPSLSCLMINSTGSTFEAQMARNTEGAFGTLSIQLPSSFQGGKHTITHGTQSSVYLRGSNDGACAFTYYYTAFFNDANHQVTPVTEGFQTSLLYDLHWKHSDKLPAECCRFLGPIRDAMLKHSRTFHLGAWTLMLGLHGEYDKTKLERNGVRVLRGKDRREFDAVKQAAAQAGLGKLGAVICSLRDDGYCSQYDDMFGTGDDWIRIRLMHAEWASLHFDDLMFRIFRRGEEETSRRLVVVYWPKQKVPTLQVMSVYNINKVLDESSQRALTASVDLALTCKEALGVDHQRAWEDTKRLAQVATKHKLIPQIIRALSFTAKLREIPNATAVVCEEKFFCLENERSKCEYGDRVRLLDELLLRELISSESGLRALGTLVEGLNKRNTPTREQVSLRSDEGIDLWSNGSSNPGRRKFNIESWSTLLRTFSRLHTTCFGYERGEEHLGGIRKRLLDVVKQLNERDLEFVTEAVETSRDIEESTFIGPQVRLSISTRKSDLLIPRFLKETDCILSKVANLHKRTWHHGFQWAKFLRLLNHTFSTHSANEAVKEKFSQFLDALPELASTPEVDRLVTEIVRLNEELAAKVTSTAGGERGCNQRKTHQRRKIASRRG